MIQTSKLLSSIPNINHGFTSKSFGVIRSIDEVIQNEVIKNRKKLAQEACLDFSKIILASQPHGNNCLQITSQIHGNLDQPFSSLPPVDALFTFEHGYTLIVNSADCVPILIAEKTGKVVSAIHAGWKGTVAEVVKRAVEQLCLASDVSPQDLLAVIGPSICGHCYDVSQVDDERIEKFQRLYKDEVEVIRLKQGKISLDLKQANKIQLLDIGIPSNQIEEIPICTFENRNWASYRRGPEELNNSIWSYISLK